MNSFLSQRMTIIGVILSFRSLLDEALKSQLEERIPFLYGTIEDVHDHNASSNRRVQCQFIFGMSAHS